MIVRVRVVPGKTVCDDIDWRFDNLSGSHHQSQLNCESSVDVPSTTTGGNEPHQVSSFTNAYFWAKNERSRFFNFWRWMLDSYWKSLKRFGGVKYMTALIFRTVIRAKIYSYFFELSRKFRNFSRVAFRWLLMVWNLQALLVTRSWNTSNGLRFERLPFVLAKGERSKRQFWISLW